MKEVSLERMRELQKKSAARDVFECKPDEFDFIIGAAIAWAENYLQEMYERDCEHDGVGDPQEHLSYP